MAATAVARSPTGVAPIPTPVVKAPTAVAAFRTTVAETPTEVCAGLQASSACARRPSR